MGTNNPFVIESPVEWVEGDSTPINFAFPNSPTITGTPTAKIYNQQTDTSATNLSGACQVSNSVVTSPTISGLVGGEDYTLAVTAVVNGRTKTVLCDITVAHPYGSQ